MTDRCNRKHRTGDTDEPEIQKQKNAKHLAKAGIKKVQILTNRAQSGAIQLWRDSATIFKDHLLH